MDVKSTTTSQIMWQASKGDEWVGMGMKLDSRANWEKIWAIHVNVPEKGGERKEKKMG